MSRMNDLVQDFFTLTQSEMRNVWEAHTTRFSRLIQADGLAEVWQVEVDFQRAMLEQMVSGFRARADLLRCAGRTAVEKVEPHQSSGEQAVPENLATPQSLQAVNGIGPVFEERLHAAGVLSLEQLAALKAEAFLSRFPNLEELHPRLVRERWIEQAQQIVR